MKLLRVHGVPSFLLAITAALATGAPAAADVIVVGPPPSGDFLDIQSAVESASNRDQIRIATGHYSEWVNLDGKSVSLIGRPGVEISGGLTIQNLGANQAVYLRDLSVAGVKGPNASLQSGHAVLLLSMTGSVSVENCDLIGASSWVSTPDLHGMYVNTSARVTVRSSTLRGGNGGGDGIRFGPTADRFHVSGSEMFGAPGDHGTPLYYGGLSQGGDGGDGLHSIASQGWLSDSTCAGGVGGGSGGFCDGPGSGGDGVNSQNGGTVFRRTVTAMAGNAGPSAGCGGLCGNCLYAYPGVTLRGAVLPLGGIQTYLEAAEYTIGSQLQLTRSGTAGSDVWYIVTSRLDFDEDGDELRLTSGSGPPFTGVDWHFEGIAVNAVEENTIPIPASVMSASDGRIYVQLVEVVAGVASYSPVEVVFLGEGEVGTSFCHGDGGDQAGCTDCPCANNAPAGAPTGCLNGTGVGCRLIATGPPTVSMNRLGFRVEGANIFTTARLASGNNALPAIGSCPVGSGVLSAGVLDGLRCMGGALIRHGNRNTNIDGMSTFGWGAPSTIPLGGIAFQGGFVAGQTRRFQAFYREAPTVNCGTGQNTSNGVEITFVP